METFICKDCGAHLSDTKTVTPGSRGMEVILVILVPLAVGFFLSWIAGVVAFFLGAVYGRWRQKNAYEVCTECDSAEVVPTTSPVGRKLMAQYHPNFDLAKLSRGSSKRFAWLFGS